MRRMMAFVSVLLGTGLVYADDVKLEKFKVEAKNADAAADLYGYNEGEGKLYLYVLGTATAEVEAKGDGLYTFTIEISGDKGENNPKVRVNIGGKDVEKEFSLTQLEPKEYTFKGDLKKGKNTIAIEFLNDEYKEGEYDANLYIHSVKFGPAKKEEKKDK